MEQQACRICGSSKLIHDAEFIDSMEEPTKVSVYENPSARVFKGRRKGAVRLCICGECGHIESYLREPAELYEAYARAHPAATLALSAVDGDSSGNLALNEAQPGALALHKPKSDDKD